MRIIDDRSVPRSHTTGNQMEISVALPKGRLLKRSESVLRSFSLTPNSNLRYEVEHGGCYWRFHLIRMQDIPQLVASGIVSVGIAPDEWIRETGSMVESIAPLGWCRPRLCLLCHGDARGSKTIGKIPPNGVNVVTEFSTIAQRYFQMAGGEPNIISVRGSCEAFLPDLADFAIDVVETGETMRRHGLFIADEIADCDVRVIANQRHMRVRSVQNAVAEFSQHCLHISNTIEGDNCSQPKGLVKW